MKNYIFCQIELTYSMAAAAVKWLKYFRYGVKQYPVNQLISWLYLTSNGDVSIRVKNSIEREREREGGV